MYSQKCAKDFRDEARAALKGNWWIGALTALAATILCVSTLFNATTLGDGGAFSSATESINQYPSYQQGMLMLVGLGISAVVFIINLVLFIFAGPLTLGYIQFNSKMLNGEKPSFKDLFSQFKRFKEGLSVHFFRWLYTFLWTLAGVGVVVVALIPCAILIAIVQGGEYFFVVVCVGLGLAAGVFIYIKMLDYTMAPYIVYDNPGIGGMEALKKSKRIMHGNKWRLFCLIFSFIGWSLLSQLPYIICALCMEKAVLFSIPFCAGALWVKAYQEVAFLAFYKQLITEDNGTFFPKDEDEHRPLIGQGNLDEVESVVSHSRWNY
ncbi:MAG: DUF975 family protein [Lachnospiraceae bacterium]|nr:DUF975 family protein [Lachnospiraceae bacterium]